jgi:hypothetical protein
MDAKTLEKMTVPKLREEARKFEDISGIHGMNKAQLLAALKQKYEIAEEKTESEVLIERKHALKKKIKQLKAEKQQALEAKEKDEKKLALLRRRLRRQRRILRKVVEKAEIQTKKSA